MEDLKERQENELIALKSIYSSNFHDLRETQNGNLTSVNKKKSNQINVPYFKITLFPVNSQSQHDLNQVYVQIDLKIKFSPEYPNEVPSIVLENEKGLSTDQIRTLHRQLVKKAQELKGGEMIYELSLEIQEFLYQNNKPPTKSFFEQRLENNLLLEKQKLEESCYEINQAKIDHQLIAEIEEARDQKRRMLQLERKKEKELEKRERLSSNNSPSRNRLSKNDFENDIRESSEKITMSKTMIPKLTCPIPNFQSFTIEFKEPISLNIKCIKLMRHEPENSFWVYRGIDINSNELFDIYEWKICLEKNKLFEKKKLETCLNEMQRIEDEFRNLSRLSNKLLVKYLAYKYYKETDRNQFTAQFCLEYVEGNTVEMFINKKQSYILLESTLRTIVGQLLDVLDYLHSSHIVHRELRPCCVHIEKNSLNIKLSDFGIVKRMNNLNELVSNEAANIMNGNSKTDIHQLGLLILSLFLGEPIKEYHPQVPTSLPPELKQFVNFCLRQADKTDCKFLKELPFMKKTSEPGYRQSSSSLIKRTSSMHYDDDEDGMRSFTDYSTQSRLNNEFEVIGVVGQGAYGEVLKVKNKLDLRFYAIKRIRINPDSKQYNKLITREIKLLSRLNHENVVRYYSTWVERFNEENQEKKLYENEGFYSLEEEINENNLSFSDEDEEDDNDVEDDDEVSSSDEESDDSGDDSRLIAWSRKETLSAVDSGSEFESEESRISESQTSSSQESVGHSKFFKSSKKVSFSLSPRDESDDSVIFAENSSDTLKKPPKKEPPQSKTNKQKARKNSDNKEKKDDAKTKRQYIYIQMEYCGGKTLKDLIDNELYKNDDKVWALFREILQGLNHIHEQGMIHRDLKPSNVLIDTSGHAKIGDFGLATSRFKMQKEHIVAPNNGIFDFALEDNLATNSLTFSSINNAYDSLQLDSLSLSGAVGTALYVAPELLTPANKNKYIYTQKVDIYSLGIMFYEMCFPFSTNMERIHVIQNLRLKDSVIKSHRPEDKKDTQLYLIKLMLNHDPKDRPSAKDLLLNEKVPRKADEVALDELLKYSFQHKQSSNYKKILKAVFDQKSTPVEDCSFDEANCKSPSSFKSLQIREYVHNQLTRIFQKHGGYMLTYPLLTPCTKIFDDYTKAFKVTDASGLVLCLPYGHRIPFARYLARSGITNIKRYQIGKVFTEKLKLDSLHPREHIEASFDIVTSSLSDCLPEIEVLSVMSDVINSFQEMTDENYVLVINHSSLLNAILNYCDIKNENQQKNIYYLLAEYNNKLTKCNNASKDNRVNWFTDRLPHLNLNESTIEKLLNFLLKSGDAQKVLSELRNLTKTESDCSKLAREAINQLKIIQNNIKILDLKIPIILSPSFVLPVISHPFEYSGFIFQLLVGRKNKKNEYDILASGGRYDNLISKFRNTLTTSQCAVGISFDFEKIAFIINDKSRSNFFRSELVVCSIGDNITPSQNNLPQSISTNSLSSLSKSKKSMLKLETPLVSSSSLFLQESINRLKLYKVLTQLNKNTNFTTHMIHQKFNTTDEMNEYCKKNSINSYTYINDSSILVTSQIFSRNELTLNSNESQNDSATDNNEASLMPTSLNNESHISFRSLIDKGFKFLEKKIRLGEFLADTNVIINNLSSFPSINSSTSQFPMLSFLTSPVNPSPPGFNFTSSLSQANLSLSTSINQSYIDFVSSLLSSQNLNGSVNTAFSSSPAVTTNLPSNSTSSTNLNTQSQLNITVLLRPAANRQLNFNRRRLEAQIVSKLSHVFSIFNSKTRIELIIVEIADIVLQVLANNLHLEQDASCYRTNWAQCMEKLNNIRYKKELTEHKLETILYELRYLKKSKVFILYSYKTDQYKLIVAS